MRMTLRALLVGVILMLTMAGSALGDEVAVSRYLAERSWPEGVDVEQLKGALIGAGTNWTELALALDEAARRYPAPDEAAQAVVNIAWLITRAPPLDRLELTSTILHNNLALAMRAAEQNGYDPLSDFFRRYVLNYRIDDEPVTDWRPSFNTGIGPSGTGGARFEPQLLRAQASAVMHGFEYRERGYFGPQADPVSIRNARAGTKSEAALLLAASLRGSGWATRFVSENASGTSWVEVYTGVGKDYDPALWVPVYPQAPERSADPAAAYELCGGAIAVVTAGDAFGREQVTGRYCSTATLAISFTRGGLPVESFEGFAVTTWRKGRYVPLDDLGYPVSGMDYPLDSSAEDASGAGKRFRLAAPGDYRLEAGVRYPGGIVDVKLLPFSLDPSTTTSLSLALDSAAELPLVAFVEREVAEMPDDPAFDPAGSYLIAVLDNSEPSIRTRELLSRFTDKARLVYVVLDETTLHERADVMLAWLQVKPDDPRPVVVLVSGGRTLLYHRGYELSIADWVQRALEEAK